MLGKDKNHLQSPGSEVSLKYHQSSDLDEGRELLGADLEQEAEGIGAWVTVLAQPDSVHVVEVFVVALSGTIPAVEASTAKLHLVDVN